jgi:predicted  nucleic acid-binding Zn-ribbon protein
MTYMGNTRTCLECGGNYYEGGNNTPNGCPRCAEVDADKLKRKHFEKLDAMTLEERIRRIEEIQYNHQTQKRISTFGPY